MSTSLHGTQKAEYWKPADSETSSTLMQPRLCPHCETELAVGARFCHVCGATRDGKKPTPAAHLVALFRSIDWAGMHERIGLNTASLVAFAAGMICVICAAFVGLIYQVQTTLDWQAIQVWRIEWLLAAIAGFCVAGVLKKPRR